MFGFKTITKFDNEKYETFVSEINRPDLATHFSICDSTYFFNISSHSLSNKYRSLMLQPVQAYLFEDTELKFFVANCLVPPKFSNLNWNHLNKFESFPPVNSVKTDSFNLNLHAFKSILPQDKINFKYVYIINWTFMAERQTKNLINQVYQNIDKFNKNDSIMVIINNSDDFYIKCGVEF